jgi:hypothetical protein
VLLHGVEVAARSARRVDCPERCSFVTRVEVFISQFRTYPHVPGSKQPISQGSFSL